MDNAGPEAIHVFNESFWEWDADLGGYRPRSCEWWWWDDLDGVLRPVEKDGWTWHPEAGDHGDWLR